MGSHVSCTCETPKQHSRRMVGHRPVTTAGLRAWSVWVTCHRTGVCLRPCAALVRMHALPTPLSAVHTSHPGIPGKLQKQLTPSWLGHRCSEYPLNNEFSCNMVDRNSYQCVLSQLLPQYWACWLQRLRDLEGSLVQHNNTAHLTVIITFSARSFSVAVSCLWR